jgi:hypothetical protein
LILACVALATLLGLACALHDDVDFGVIACLADGACFSPITPRQLRAKKGGPMPRMFRLMTSQEVEK